MTVFRKFLNVVEQYSCNTCGSERSTENRRSHQKADRAEHAGEAAAVEHLIHKGRIRMDGEAAVHVVHHVLERDILENHTDCCRYSDTCDKCRDCRFLPGDKTDDDKYRDQSNRIKVKALFNGAQNFNVSCAFSCASAAEFKTVNKEEHQAD